jgi:hypothetical protein
MKLLKISDLNSSLQDKISVECSFIPKETGLNQSYRLTKVVQSTPTKRILYRKLNEYKF